ncbi:hypothetical protein ACROYT_G009518 [Oculina patagonica]
MLALVSARPSPELSLQEIEKELEQLTAQENDASETTKKTSEQADTEKDTQTVPKEITEKTKDVSKEKLEALEKSVTETEQKKDETDKTEAETEKTADSTSSDPAVPPNKPVKPAPPEIPHRDSTDADIEREDLSSRGLPKLSFKDTAAYRRLMETADSRFSPLPKIRADYKYADYPSFPKPRQHFPEAPIRRTYNGYYRKGYDNPPNDSSWNRGGFLPNSDPIEALRGIPSEMTRAERMALSRGTWLPDNKPVKVPHVLPAPEKPDVDVRSYNGVHQQLNDKETEDLIHGKSGLTDAELRKRYLMDLLAEKLKSRVSEAQKRGLKIPTKIMDFLWNYEARRGIDTQPDKTRLSH